MRTRDRDRHAANHRMALPWRPIVIAGLLLAGCNTQPAPAPSQPAAPAAPPVAAGRAATENAAPPAESAAEPAPPPLDGPPVAEAPRPLTDRQLDDGWISLFDGQTLFGWQAASDANWRVEQGAIVVDSGQPGLLYTTTQFADYVLQLEFRSAPGTNSGVFLHTPARPNDPSGDCYELNIADSDNPFPTGSLVRRARAEGDFDSRDWQAYEVTVEGARVRVQLDGEPVLEYVDPAPLARGHIGLQLNQGRVEFRNIRLKPLGLADIFNGRNLDGWQTYPEMESEFTVSDEGWLHVRGGRGQLETADRYGDFALQLECNTHAPRLNSGIFFRCIPGDVMMGYESQIHNGFLHGDRRQPQDWGTGAIFRRQKARLVAADDQQWFWMTLMADGPHVACWVNGYQVTDWTDERPPDENPRRGLRLEPGTIMIQGHDPTTDISFRDLRAAELAPRRGP